MVAPRVAPRFGLLLPTTSRGRGLLSADSILQFAVQADTVGLHSVWAYDHVSYPHRIHEPLTVLAAAAPLTHQVRLATGVLLLPARNPLVVARQVATLDHLSGGRVVVGVGLGADPERWQNWAVSTAQRRRRLEEGVALLRQCWSQERVDFHGHEYKVSDAVVLPKPVQRPYPPIWLGGVVKPALRRAGRLGDGYVASFLSVAEMRRAVAAVHEAARSAGKADFPTALITFSYLRTGDVARDREAEQFFTKFFGGEAAERGLVGSPAEMRERCQQFFDAGVDLLVFGPLEPRPESVRRYMAEVVDPLEPAKVVR